MRAIQRQDGGAGGIVQCGTESSSCSRTSRMAMVIPCSSDGGLQRGRPGAMRELSHGFPGLAMTRRGRRAAGGRAVAPMPCRGRRGSAGRRHPPRRRYFEHVAAPPRRPIIRGCACPSTTTSACCATRASAPIWWWAFPLQQSLAAPTWCPPPRHRARLVAGLLRAVRSGLLAHHARDLAGAALRRANWCGWCWSIWPPFAIAYFSQQPVRHPA